MALGDGASWDETTPTDATVAINIDDYNRDLRVGVRSRMALEHEWPSSQSATAEAGMHKYMTLQMQSTHPTLAGTQVAAVYARTVGTTGDGLFYVNAATQEINVSKKTYFWFLEGAFSTGTNVSAKLVLHSAGRIKRAGAYCSTTGTDLTQFDVLYNGSSIWTATSSQIILATGSTGTSVSGFVTVNVTSDGVLTLDVDKLGAGCGSATVWVEVW